MIVDSLKKGKKRYIVTIDGNEYSFSEDIVVEYRLVQGKEIDEATLEEAKKKENVWGFYDKALSYSIRFAKNSAEVYDYLLDKGLSNMEIAEIIDKLQSIKAINDLALAKSHADYLARHGNGKLLIEKKMRERKFSSELINNAIEAIDYDIYNEALNKMYDKVKDKYKGDSYTIKMKVKNYLLQRGYTYSDLSNIDFD